jgi:hypothetical protein
MNKIIKTFQKVIEGWGLLEILLFFIFIPFSLVYVGFRFVQEWEE